MKYGDPVYHFAFYLDGNIQITEVHEEFKPEDVENHKKAYNDLYDALNNSESLICMVYSKDITYVVSEDEEVLRNFRSGMVFVLSGQFKQYLED